ncbi:type II toxin-antitoxin system VapC family toxin [Halococcoides cellulosivorans]|uniref:PIN domain nuclease n=1 Tax=Halococcoides cellulosivorans TaxID=1679096 RepID=A0A2R4WYD1_9EURY|nr:type II toxin-antitoxin system VapC family toxin [Halococcoides cellulosivorans]AWB26531.1 PIN domain nuclease [Halococcoides cellulosivorans]
MIDADTDFFIALVEDDDWLGERAAAIAAEYEGELYSSRATLLELLMVSDRFEFDRMAALSYALEIATVDADVSVLFQAADYMDEYGLTAFDAYHLAFAGDDPIVSSDQAFDDVTDDRIPIEEGNERE